MFGLLDEVEYKILETSTADEMMQKVAELQKDGWKIFGNLVVTVGHPVIKGGSGAKTYIREMIRPKFGDALFDWAYAETDHTLEN